MPPLRLEDAQQIKEVIVDPLIEAVRAEIAPIRDITEKHEIRIGKIETNQTRALVGWGVVMLGVTMFFNAVWTWVKSKFGWGE